MNPIREDYVVYVHDGDKQIGAVRHVSKDGIRVYVENAGDFEVPLTAVRDVTDDKVTLDSGKLSADLRKAIGHAHQGEDPRIP
jgi:hypothetical protein